jgi:hypothetical protein
VFKPGEAKNCRCTAEPVPYLVTVVPKPARSLQKQLQHVCVCKEGELLALWKSFVRFRDVSDRLLHYCETHHPV